ncbi:hypothetical protein [Streptomyces sp. NPDC001774]
MATSRVPAAVDALLEILRAAPALATVRVIDGPEPVNLTERQRIYIGWQPSAESAVSLVQDFNAAGARTRDEDFVIVGYVEARGGDKNMAIRRNQAFAILAAVEDALRATDLAPETPTLNGTVLWAHLTTGDLFQQQTEGAIAGINFAVSCRARI